MRLSVCMIVRNEESRLAAAIESVRAVADEIIVTDTGSTDNTIDLARSLGARVETFAWCDDFAAARNACAVHARGEWILWLDADEKLKPGNDAGLARDLADTRTLAYQLIREDYFSRDRPDWFSEMYQLRLVRRDLPATFVGRIHEHLVPSPVEIARKIGKSVKISTARLVHRGYSNDRLPEKMARGAMLCELELKERPGQLYYMVELARSLIALNTPESHERGNQVLGEATQLMLSHASDPHPPSTLAASLLEQLFAIPDRPWATTDELIDLATRWFPRNPPLVWALARTYTYRAQWERAEQELRKLLEMLRTRNYDHFGSFDPRIAEDASFNLGVVLVRQARLDEAIEIFTSLLTSERRAGEARRNLDAITELKAKFGD